MLKKNWIIFALTLSLTVISAVPVSFPVFHQSHLETLPALAVHQHDSSIHDSSIHDSSIHL
jgi:hypothetical protein